jgi:ubiquinone/menaquinone biosynthesis C-methylase UbiE
MKCTICQSPAVERIVVLQKGQKIFACNTCHNAFTVPAPVAPDYTVGDFHANGTTTPELTYADQLPEEIRTSYSIQASLVAKHVAKSEKILEIGGGEGIFLNKLMDLGYDVEMVEPSLTAADRARKRGIKVHNGYFHETKFNAQFGLITMAHVLEHIADPKNVMVQLRKLLQPNGFLLLTQTNYKGFMPKLLKEHWYAWVPDEHFSHFTVAGLKYLAQQTGYDLVDYKYSRLYHGKSIYHSAVKYVPFLQDQIHVLLKSKVA